MPSARLDHVSLTMAIDEDRGGIEISAECHITGKTGVEMEALTAVSVTALTIYDMCKAVDKAMIISDIKLVYKAGGKSGTYDVRQAPAINGGRRCISPYSDALHQK